MTFSLDGGVSILERTPGTLRALLGGLDPEWTARNEGGDTWTPFDIVGHLIDGEEFDWLPRVRVVLSDSADRRFVPIDRFRHLTVNKGRTMTELLDAFAAARTRSIGMLRGLEITSAQLQRTAEHPAFGAVTLTQLLATWTVHDLNHIAQVVRVMAKQYRDDIGPWEAFLPVVRIPSGGSG